MYANKLMAIPLYIAVFFIPVVFVGWPSISTVWSDPFGICLIIGFFIMLIFHFCGMKIYMPRSKQLKIFLLFIAYHIITGIINYYDLASDVFDSRLVLQKYIIYIFFLCIMFGVDIYIYNVLKIKKSMKILLLSKVLLVALFLELVYSLIQFMGIIGMPMMIDLVTNIGPAFGRGELGMRAYFLKLYGFTGEPSSLANFIIFTFPWLLIIFYNIKNKMTLKIMFICLLVVDMFVLFMTFSRTAYFGAVLSCLIGILLFKKELINFIKKDIKKIITASIIFFCAINCIVSYILVEWKAPVNLDEMINVTIASFINEDERKTNGSNITRVAGMYAAVNAAADKPLLGCGFGTLSLYQNKYYPNWAVASEEIVNGLTVVESKTHGFREMPTMVIARTLAEGGIIGMLIWIMMFLVIIIDCLKLNKKSVGIKSVYIRCVAWMAIISQILAINTSYIFSYIYVLLFPIYWSIRDDIYSEYEK